MQKEKDYMLSKKQIKLLKYFNAPILEEPEYIILKVKRVSDGKIFSLNEKVQVKGFEDTPHLLKITSFKPYWKFYMSVCDNFVGLKDLIKK